MDPLKVVKWFGGGIGVVLLLWFGWVLISGNLNVGRTFIDERQVDRQNDPLTYYGGVVLLGLFIAGYWAAVFWLLRNLPKYLEQAQDS